MQSLSDIDDLLIRSKQDEKEVVFKKQVSNPIPIPTSQLVDDVDDNIFNDIKDVKQSPTVEDDDETDNSNILFISDTSRPDFKLENFQHTVEYEKFLFANRTIEQIFEQCKYLWLNINNKDGRVWLGKNLKKCHYNISLVYTDKEQKWIKDIEAYLTKIKCSCCSKISLNKLMKVQSFNEEEFIGNIMQTAVSLSKPTFKIVNFLKGCLCSKKKCLIFKLKKNILLFGVEKGIEMFISSMKLPTSIGQILVMLMSVL